MHSYNDDLLALATSVRQGDPIAAARFRREMEPQAVLIVRRVMQSGSTASPYGSWVLAEARRVARELPPAAASRRDQVIFQVARRLCDKLTDLMLNRVRAEQPARETVLA